MIPKDWLSITLGQACKEKIKTGPFGSQLHAHEYVESGIPVIMPKDLLNGNIIIDKAARISQEKADVLSKHKLENGDLIFSRRGNVTCAAIVTVKEVGCICGTGCLRVRLDKNCVSPPFLNALIQNENVKDWLESNAVGQTMLNLNTTILSNLPIQIPPLLEQCRIAEVLGVWDESIDLLERLIGRIRSRKQGLMQQLLTGKKRFKEFEGSEWENTFIKKIAKLTAGGTPDTNIFEYWNGDIPWMKSGDVNLRKIHKVDGRITQSGFDNSSTKRIPPHSVLIALAGQGKTRGLVAINEIELCTNQSIAAIIPNPSKLYFEYLYYNLESRYQELRALSSGDGGRGGLNLKIIGQIEICLPSLPEQEKIAAVLSAADEEISTLEKQLAAYKQQKLGLMQQLLTGRIRI
jgi:type I restriction enzyme, S subunit